MNVGPQSFEDNCTNKMGKDLASCFFALRNELAITHLRWKQFCILFAEKPSRVDLLNKAAPSFFRMVQDIVFFDILLGIARLFDKPEHRGKKTLTLYQLPPLVTDSDFKKELARVVNEARKASEFARDWRNRRIVHRDFNLTVNGSASPLAEATRKNIDHSLSSLAAVLNHIERKYMGSTSPYEDSIGALGGAENLLYVLREGIRCKQDKWERRRRGDYVDRPEPV